jgi:hypothetical protein
MRKTTGISRRLFFASAIPLLAQKSDAYALIAGSVFRETGHAFPGIEVKLVPAQKSKKFKEQSVRTTPRGEFAFRLPAEAMEYELSVSVSGYRPESKRVKIVGDERVDENFLLERAR